MKLISFTVTSADTGEIFGTYQAEEGMTWEEFVNSNYNSNGDFSISDTYIKYARDGYFTPPYDQVTQSDVIENGKNYDIGARGFVFWKKL